MTEEDWRIAEREWHDPANWWGPRWMALYRAPRDPRVWVRKRVPQFGWTINFAHRAGWLWAALILAVPVAVALISALR